MKTLLLLAALTAPGAFAFQAQIDDSRDLSPVPEPATIALMGAGLAGVGFAAWRKNRKK